jgi:hypothetical protein
VVLDEEKEDQEIRELEVVRGIMGRPLFLTAKRFVRICKHIEMGQSVTAACRLELVDYSGFRRHVQRNEKYQARLKEAEAIRFQRRHEEAVESVMRAGEKSWMAHAWYLERVLPNLYALKNVNRSEASTDQPVGDRIDETQLRRYSELMEQFRKENEAKSVALPAPESA